MSTTVYHCGHAVSSAYSKVGVGAYSTCTKYTSTERLCSTCVNLKSVVLLKEFKQMYTITH